jgi:hypothetical protein
MTSNENRTRHVGVFMSFMSFLSDGNDQIPQALLTRRLPKNETKRQRESTTKARKQSALLRVAPESADLRDF